MPTWSRPMTVTMMRLVPDGIPAMLAAGTADWPSLAAVDRPTPAGIGPKCDLQTAEPNLGRSFGTFNASEFGRKRLLDQAEHAISGAKRRCKPAVRAGPPRVALLVNSRLADVLRRGRRRPAPADRLPHRARTRNRCRRLVHGPRRTRRPRRRRHRHPPSRRHPRRRAPRSGFRCRCSTTACLASCFEVEQPAEPARRLRHPAGLRAHGRPARDHQDRRSKRSRPPSAGPTAHVTRTRSAPRPPPGAGARRRRCAAAPRSCRGW